MVEAKRAYEEWRDAEAAARLAEAELAAAWRRFSEKAGPAPTESLMAEVSRRRRVANACLSRAMARMAEARPGSGSSTWPSSHPFTPPEQSSDEAHP